MAHRGCEQVNIELGRWLREQTSASQARLFVAVQTLALRFEVFGHPRRAVNRDRFDTAQPFYCRSMESMRDGSGVFEVQPWLAANGHVELAALLEHMKPGGGGLPASNTDYAHKSSLRMPLRVAQSVLKVAHRALAGLAKRDTAWLESVHGPYSAELEQGFTSPTVANKTLHWLFEGEQHVDDGVIPQCEHWLVCELQAATAHVQECYIPFDGGGDPGVPPVRAATEELGLARFELTQAAASLGVRCAELAAAVKQGGASVVSLLVQSSRPRVCAKADVAFWGDTLSKELARLCMPPPLIRRFDIALDRAIHSPGPEPGRVSIATVARVALELEAEAAAAQAPQLCDEIDSVIDSVMGCGRVYDRDSGPGDDDGATAGLGEVDLICSRVERSLPAGMTHASELYAVRYRLRNGLVSHWKANDFSPVKKMYHEAVRATSRVYIGWSVSTKFATLKTRLRGTPNLRAAASALLDETVRAVRENLHRQDSIKFQKGGGGVEELTNEIQKQTRESGAQFSTVNGADDRHWDAFEDETSESAGPVVVRLVMRAADALVHRGGGRSADAAAATDEDDAAATDEDDAAATDEDNAAATDEDDAAEENEKRNYGWRERLESLYVDRRVAAAETGLCDVAYLLRVLDTDPGRLLSNYSADWALKNSGDSGCLLFSRWVRRALGRPHPDTYARAHDVPPPGAPTSLRDSARWAILGSSIVMGQTPARPKRWDSLAGGLFKVVQRQHPQASGLRSTGTWGFFGLFYWDHLVLRAGVLPQASTRGRPKATAEAEALSTPEAPPARSWTASSRGLALLLDTTWSCAVHRAVRRSGGEVSPLDRLLRKFIPNLRPETAAARPSPQTLLVRLSAFVQYLVMHFETGEAERRAHFAGAWLLLFAADAHILGRSGAPPRGTDAVGLWDSLVEWHKWHDARQNDGCVRRGQRRRHIVSPHVWQHRKLVSDPDRTMDDVAAALVAENFFDLVLGDESFPSLADRRFRRFSGERDVPAHKIMFDVVTACSRGCSHGWLRLGKHWFKRLVYSPGALCNFAVPSVDTLKEEVLQRYSGAVEAVQRIINNGADSGVDPLPTAVYRRLGTVRFYLGTLATGATLSSSGFGLLALGVRFLEDHKGASHAETGASVADLCSGRLPLSPGACTGTLAERHGAQMSATLHGSSGCDPQLWAATRYARSLVYDLAAPLGVVQIGPDLGANSPDHAVWLARGLLPPVIPVLFKPPELLMADQTVCSLFGNLGSCVACMRGSGEDGVLHTVRTALDVAQTPEEMWPPSRAAHRQEPAGRLSFETFVECSRAFVEVATGVCARFKAAAFELEAILGGVPTWAGAGHSPSELAVFLRDEGTLFFYTGTMGDDFLRGLGQQARGLTLEIDCEPVDCEQADRNDGGSVDLMTAVGANIDCCENDRRGGAAQEQRLLAEGALGLCGDEIAWPAGADACAATFTLVARTLLGVSFLGLAEDNPFSATTLWTAAMQRVPALRRLIAGDRVSEGSVSATRLGVVFRFEDGKLARITLAEARSLLWGLVFLFGTVRAAVSRYSVEHHNSDNHYALRTVKFATFAWARRHTGRGDTAAARGPTALDGAFEEICPVQLSLSCRTGVPRLDTGVSDYNALFALISAPEMGRLCGALRSIQRAAASQKVGPDALRSGAIAGSDWTPGLCAAVRQALATAGVTSSRGAVRSGDGGLDYENWFVQELDRVESLVGAYQAYIVYSRALWAGTSGRVIADTLERTAVQWYSKAATGVQIAEGDLSGAEHIRSLYRSTDRPTSLDKSVCAILTVLTFGRAFGDSQRMCLYRETGIPSGNFEPMADSAVHRDPAEGVLGRQFSTGHDTAMLPTHSVGLFRDFTPSCEPDSAAAAALERTLFHNMLRSVRELNTQVNEFWWLSRWTTVRSSKWLAASLKLATGEDGDSSPRGLYWTAPQRWTTGFMSKKVGGLLFYMGIMSLRETERAYTGSDESGAFTVSGENGVDIHVDSRCLLDKLPPPTKSTDRLGDVLRRSPAGVQSHLPLAYYINEPPGPGRLFEVCKSAGAPPGDTTPLFYPLPPADGIGPDNCLFFVDVNAMFVTLEPSRYTDDLAKVPQSSSLHGRNLIAVEVAPQESIYEHRSWLLGQYADGYEWFRRKLEVALPEYAAMGFETPAAVDGVYTFLPTSWEDPLSGHMTIPSGQELFAWYGRTPIGGGVGEYDRPYIGNTKLNTALLDAIRQDAAQAAAWDLMKSVLAIDSESLMTDPKARVKLCVSRCAAEARRLILSFEPPGHKNLKRKSPCGQQQQQQQQHHVDEYFSLGAVLGQEGGGGVCTVDTAWGGHFSDQQPPCQDFTPLNIGGDFWQ